VELAKDLACINPQCPKFGIKGEDNIIVRKWLASGTIRFVRCRQCRSEVSERRGTAMFNFRISTGQFIDVVKHLGEGVGVRKTSRLTGVARDTVGRVLRATGGQAKAIHDALVRGLDVPEVQMDEMWSFVKKR
jgi:transposase-like protein